MIAAVLVLAAGTYAFRLTGVILGDRPDLPEGLRRALIVAAATLLAALAATAALTEVGRVAGIARPVGVLVGALLAGRRAPFIAVILAAAATAAGLRVLGCPDLSATPPGSRARGGAAESERRALAGPDPADPHRVNPEAVARSSRRSSPAAWACASGGR